jgi:cystathionine beta-lyase/cystathionine gamma-synthase
MDTPTNWDLITKLNHPKFIDLKPGNHPLIQPIYHSAKFTPSSDFSYTDQFLYSRVSNPTTRQLEVLLAETMLKDDCLCFSSGMAALANTFLSLLKAGDHVISFKEIYRPSRSFFREILPHFNISSDLIHLDEMDDLHRFIKPGKTKLIHFESPTNPNLEIADIDKIIKFARINNILVSMDATFGGIHQHLEYDLDILVHSLTKFANGHGDVIAGSVSGKNEIIKKIRDFSIYSGAALDPASAGQILRGLKTYPLRFEHQTRTAQILFEFLSHNSAIKKVFYPQCDLAKKQMKQMGSVISFELDSKIIRASDFCHRLKLIKLAPSLGSTESLCAPSKLFFGMDLTEAELLKMGLNDYTIRLSVGLEHWQDLISDLENAFKH